MKIKTIGKSVLLLALGWLLGVVWSKYEASRDPLADCDQGDEAAWINELEMELTK